MTRWLHHVGLSFQPPYVPLRSPKPVKRERGNLRVSTKSQLTAQHANLSLPVCHLPVILKTRELMTTCRTAVAYRQRVKTSCEVASLKTMCVLTRQVPQNDSSTTSHVPSAMLVKSSTMSILWLNLTS